MYISHASVCMYLCNVCMCILSSGITVIDRVCWYRNVSTYIYRQHIDTISENRRVWPQPLSSLSKLRPPQYVAIVAELSHSASYALVKTYYMCVFYSFIIFISTNAANPDKSWRIHSHVFISWLWPRRLSHPVSLCCTVTIRLSLNTWSGYWLWSELMRICWLLAAVFRIFTCLFQVISSFVQV